MFNTANFVTNRKSSGTKYPKSVFDGLLIISGMLLIIVAPVSKRHHHDERSSVRGHFHDV